MAGKNKARHRLRRPRRELALHRGQAIDGPGRLRAGRQAVRRGRAPASLFDLGAPRAADERVQLLSRAEIYRRDQLGPALPHHPPGQCRGALRAISDRDELLSADRRRDPRPDDDAAGVRRVRRADPPLSRHAAMPPTRGSSSTSSTTISPARRWRSAASTSARASGSRRPIASAPWSTSTRRPAHTPEALERLVECYLALGVPEEAQKAAAVLGRNYPESYWYKQSLKLLGRENSCTPAGGRLRGSEPQAGGPHMLRQLAIHNIVLVERLELEFEPGLGVLTGETGAGKSILLDALGLALGARADTGLVRAGRGRGVGFGRDRACRRSSGARAARRAGHRSSSRASR